MKNKSNFRDGQLALAMQSSDDSFSDLSTSSDVVPGGDTSPSLVFKMFAKSGIVPKSEFHSSDSSDLPLEQSHMPRSVFEVYSAFQRKSNDALLQSLKEHEDMLKQAELDAHDLERLRADEAARSNPESNPRSNPESNP